MVTIPPKTWSWRGHSSGQNILFFQVIQIKLVANEGTLSHAFPAHCIAIGVLTENGY
jgi:hypothetical protein